MTTATSVLSTTSRSERSSIAETFISLKLLSRILCGSVFFLIFMGANVTSNDAGLAVPDWPTSFGYNMFTFPVSYWVGGIWHEHVHRLVASVVGALTVLLCVLTLIRERRKVVRGLSIVAVFVVVLQGVLGGLTVLNQLPTWISATHGVLAQSFFCLTILIAYLHSQEFHGRSKAKIDLRTLPFVFVLAVIFLQLVIGAVMRHSEAGLAIPSLQEGWNPFAAQELSIQANQLRKDLRLAPVNIEQVNLHIAHRINGVIVLITVLLGCGGAIWTRRIPNRVQRTAKVLIGVVLLQFGLGLYAIFSNRMPLPTSLHVVVGALSLGLAFFLLLRAACLSAK